MSKKCKHLKGDWCENDGYTKREKPCPKGFSDTNTIPCHEILPPKKKLVKVKAWCHIGEITGKVNSAKDYEDTMHNTPCTITYDSKYLKGRKK